MTITIILITAKMLSAVWFVNILASQKPEPNKENKKTKKSGRMRWTFMEPF